MKHELCTALSRGATNVYTHLNTLNHDYKNNTDMVTDIQSVLKFLLPFYDRGGKKKGEPLKIESLPQR